MTANIKLKDGQACGNSLISLSLCRHFCCLFNLFTLLLQVQINSFFFSSSLSLPDLFTHSFLPNPPQKTAFFSFSHSFLLTIWFSLLSKPVWLAYLTGDCFGVFFFFRRKPYRHSDTGPLLTEIQTHLPRSILTITFDPNMAPVTAISDGGWWSKTSQERRQCTEVSYETCRVSAKSESKQQQLWGKKKKCLDFSLSNCAVIKLTQSKSMTQKLFFFMSEISDLQRLW